MKHICPNNNVKIDLASENLDKGKSILGAPLKQDKKEAKNPRAKKDNSKKPKQKKQHLCHHYGVPIILDQIAISD